MHFSDATETTREKTPEGMLRASAIITRAGLFPYDAGELGQGADGQTIMVERPLASIKDPETLASIRGAPVTLGHPPAAVEPENWAQFVVGNVVGEPTVDGTGNVIADILIGRQDAVQLVDLGMAELSIGYDFIHKPAPEGSAAALLTDGPLQVNHVAIVERGRAGPGVRILDQKDSVMTDAEIAKIAAAVKSALDSNTGSADTAGLAQAVTSAIKPTLDAIGAMKKKMEEEEDEKKRAAAEMSHKKRADELVAAATADGYARAEMVSNAVAKGLLKDGAEMRGKTAKEIAIAILGDSVQNAASLDEAYLQGRVDAMLVSVGQGGQKQGIGQPAKPSQPPGVASAYDAFVKGFEWKEAS